MNPSRVHLERFLSEAATSLPAGALVLDAGAGDCVHRALFEHARYESCDFAQVDGKTYGSLTYVCDITEIPVEDGRYDAIVCTQVLAHLPDPGAALAELARVLKPGGTLHLTAPLVFQENEPPYDFHRFTRYGIRLHLERAGLEAERLEPLDGVGALVSYAIRTGRRSLPFSPAAYGGGLAGLASSIAVWLTMPFALVLSEVLARADVRHPLRDGTLIKNWAVVARRPGLPGDERDGG